jgi:hypothetical protein
MGLWEKMNNPDFNLTGFRGVKAALSQAKRLTQLNATAIIQLKSLLEHDTIKQLEEKS